MDIFQSERTNSKISSVRFDINTIKPTRVKPTNPPTTAKIIVSKQKLK